MVTKEQLEEYQKAYSRGNPMIDDETYDVLLEEYLQANGGESNRPFNRNKQSTEVNDIVGTLPKVYGVTEPMRPGMKTYQMWVESKSITDESIMLQAKLDGCSVAFDCNTGKWYTRGDYDNGESVDVTDVFKDHWERIKWYAVPGTQAIKFEAILSHEIYYDEDLEIYKRYEKRPRDFVSAAISSHNAKMASYITLIPLRATINGMHYIPKALSELSITLSSPTAFDEVESFIKQKLSDGATVKFHNKTFSIDGVVASAVKPSKDVIWVDPTKEVAIKILKLIKETKLISIDFQFGKQGRITPVAIFEPIDFDGVKVDHATLSTIERVTSMGLCHNDTIRIMYNIVPYFIDSKRDGDYPIQVPRKCPICGADLDYTSIKQVRCSNPDCRGLILGNIIRYAEKMKMMGISSGIITRLYDEGIIKSIIDLYSIKDNKEIISNLDGFGLQSWGNMVTTIENTSRNIKPARFLGALPINDTSESTWENIILVMGPSIMEHLKNKTFVETAMNIGYIPNVGSLKLKKIFDGVLRHQDEIIKLINLLEPNFVWETNKVSKGKVAMTGTRDANITKLLEDNGYTVGSFTNDCIALIVPDMNFTSAKTIKAKQLNIPIIQLSDVERMIINESL